MPFCLVMDGDYLIHLIHKKSKVDFDLVLGIIMIMLISYFRVVG